MVAQLESQLHREREVYIAMTSHLQSRQQTSHSLSHSAVNNNNNNNKQHNNNHGVQANSNGQIKQEPNFLFVSTFHSYYLQVKSWDRTWKIVVTLDQYIIFRLPAFFCEWLIMKSLIWFGLSKIKIRNVKICISIFHFSNAQVKVFTFHCRRKMKPFVNCRNSGCSKINFVVFFCEICTIIFFSWNLQGTPLGNLFLQNGFINNNNNNNNAALMASLTNIANGAANINSLALSSPPSSVQNTTNNSSFINSASVNNTTINNSGNNDCSSIKSSTSPTTSEILTSLINRQVAITSSMVANNQSGGGTHHALSASVREGGSGLTPTMTALVTSTSPNGLGVDVKPNLFLDTSSPPTPVSGGGGPMKRRDKSILPLAAGNFLLI